MRHEDESYRLVLEEQDHARLEQEMKVWDSVALLLVIAFVVWLACWVISFVRNEARCNKQLARIEVRRLQREQKCKRRTET